MRQKLAKVIYNSLGPDFGGTPNPPGSTLQLKFGGCEDKDPTSPQMYIADTSCNDGFELWLGTRHKWHVFYSAIEARKLAWFILWTWWAKGTWFGLKRKVWYWGLHQIVEAQRIKVGR